MLLSSERRGRRLMIRGTAAIVSAGFAVALLSGCESKAASDMPSESGTALPESVDVVISTESLPLLEAQVDGVIEAIENCLSIRVRGDSAVPAYVLVLPPGSRRTDTGAGLSRGLSINLGESVELAGGEAPAGGVAGYSLPASCSTMPAFLVNEHTIG